MLDRLSSNSKSTLDDDNIQLKINELESKLKRKITFKITPLKQIRRINNTTSMGVCEYVSGNSVYDTFFDQNQTTDEFADFKYDILILLSNIFQKITGLNGSDFDFVNVKLIQDGESLAFIFTDILSNVQSFDFDKFEI